VGVLYVLFGALVLGSQSPRIAAQRLIGGGFYSITLLGSSVDFRGAHAMHPQGPARTGKVFLSYSGAAAHTPK